MIRAGLVGLGKIARDQHLPAIAASDRVELAAIASRNARLDGIPHFADLDAMLAAPVAVDAVILCQPPQVRYAAARAAIAAGRHVFLEKPPGATVSEVVDLADAARAAGVTLFASWHARHASGVAAARAWLSGKHILGVSIVWKEDVRHWHPGQDWIWKPGGLGVFDPGINALSILTHLMPGTVRLEHAALTFPANREAPIAALLAMRSADGAPIAAEFDWRQIGPQSWDITVETDQGTLLLSHGGNRLAIDGVSVALAPEAEYPDLYRHFADLIGAGRSDVDTAPLLLVADAFLTGQRSATEPFDD